MRTKIGTILVTVLCLGFFVACPSPTSPSPTSPAAVPVSTGPLSIGDTGPSGVGIVFYVTDGGIHGLEAAPGDQSAGMIWCLDNSLEVLGTSKEIGAGMANTTLIIAAQGTGTYAASACTAYHGGNKTDWFLPSLNELKEMAAKLYQHSPSLGGFTTDGDYWASSQTIVNNNNFYVFSTPLANGNSSAGNSFRVRAVRAF